MTVFIKICGVKEKKKPLISIWNHSRLIPPSLPRLQGCQCGRQLTIRLTMGNESAESDKFEFASKGSAVKLT
jgi:hypothetical protein